MQSTFKSIVITIAVFALMLCVSCASAERAPTTRRLEPKQYNVLLIGIDDLNDWIGALGGHPQAKTPNLDRLAASGINFTKAYCPAPICNPSRAAMLTGMLPSSTGIYYLAPSFRKTKTTDTAVSLPQHFQRNGYRTMAAGKIFHANQTPPEFESYAGNMGGMGPRPEQPINCDAARSKLWDWGVYPDSDEKMPDHKIASWAIEQLKQEHDKPFFLACGFYRPHVPLYAPQKWFDMHPLDKVKLPEHRDDDLKDVSQYGQDLTWSYVAPRHQWLLDNNEWEKATQGYLASTTFVDHQVGRVLDALEKSEYADNTIVVCFSDHGFHMGTKERWGKRSLWEDSARVVFMIRLPGDRAKGDCDRPVGLIDLYPTLVELCGLPELAQLEGRDISTLLVEPKADWPYPALTTFGQNNHGIRSEHFRYIVYADGSEELYDHRKDPHEFNNLAGDPSYKKVIAEHRRWLPKVNVPMAPGSAAADARPGSKPDIDKRKQ